MTDNLLEIKNLTVEYTTEGDVVHAVNGVDLCIRHGESLGLVGETGAGKTTTALSVLNLISTPPGTIKSGEIIFEGQNLLKLPKLKMRAIRGKLHHNQQRTTLSALPPSAVRQWHYQQAIAPRGQC